MIRAILVERQTEFREGKLMRQAKKQILQPCLNKNQQNLAKAIAWICFYRLNFDRYHPKRRWLLSEMETIVIENGLWTLDAAITWFEQNSTPYGWNIGHLFPPKSFIPA